MFLIVLLSYLLLLYNGRLMCLMAFSALYSLFFHNNIETLWSNISLIIDYHSGVRIKLQ